MKKQDIVSELVTVISDISANKLEAILTQLVKIITDAVNRGEQVKISGLGTFTLKQMKERPGFNPQTKEKLTIAAYKAVKFKASETLKKAVK